MAYINYHAWQWCSDILKFRGRHWEYDFGLMRNFSGFHLLLMSPWLGLQIYVNFPHWNWDTHYSYIRDFSISLMWKMNNPIEDGGLIYKHTFYRHWYSRPYEPEIVGH